MTYSLTEQHSAQLKRQVANHLHLETRMSINQPVPYFIIDQKLIDISDITSFNPYGHQLESESWVDGTIDGNGN